MVEPDHTVPFPRDVETIVAISTPPGQGGIGIVRLSGPDAIVIGRKLFRSRTSVLGKRIRHIEMGIFLGEHGQEIDHGLAWVFARPNSYTGEDVVELSCHGNAIILEAVVRTAICHGAVMAGHGEFTRRAFLNGKLDLMQVEAVVDLIQAGGQFSLENAYGHLKGSLSTAVGGLKDTLLKVLAQVEVLLDFSEEDLHVDLRQVSAGLESAFAQSRQLTDSFTGSSRRHEGLAIVIVGPPNAGKSSLFNALLKENRAIVSPTPGTTRDLIEARVYVGGELYRLVDTAGLHATTDSLESEGIGRALTAWGAADTVFFVLDASVPWSDEYFALLDSLRPKRDVVVLNKADLPKGILLPSEWPFRTVETSTVSGFGTAQLIEFLRLSRNGKLGQSEGIGLTRLRHYNGLVEVGQYVQRALGLLSGAIYNLECLADDLRNALEALALLQGVNVNEETLDLIFAEFCIGK